MPWFFAPVYSKPHAPGVWSSRLAHCFVHAGRPVHICHDGCCDSKDDSKKKAADLIYEFLLRPAQIPALNKWTKAFPCVGATVLLASFSGVARFCFDKQFKLSERASSESSAEDPEDKALGVPLNESKRWRKLARKRNEKARRFVGDEQANFSNMLWLHTASPIMTLHWKLFKTETWHCDRPQEDPAQTIRVGQFCVLDTNPAMKVAAELMQILLDPDTMLATMSFLFGHFQTWSQERKRMLRRAIVVCLGQLLRKLVQPFLCYPWRLWPLAHPRSSSNARTQCVAELGSARECCCDSGCSQRLKAMQMANPDVLSERAFQEFFQTIFQQIVLTSTFIERKFANFSHWTTQSQGRKNTLSLLAAKHITRSFQNTVESWRERNNIKKQSQKFRPAWVKEAKSSRLDGFHMFTQERKMEAGKRIEGAANADLSLRQISNEWSQLSPSSKSKYSERAKAENARREALKLAAAPPSASTPGGPWNPSAFGGGADAAWPVRAEVMQHFLDVHGFDAAAKQWVKDNFVIAFTLCESTSILTYHM